MPPVVAGINHCASIQELRLTDGTDAMPLVRERATEPVVKWALDTLRRAAVLLDALDGVLPADAAPGGALRRHGAGRGDALRHHHPRHGVRAGARARAGGAGETWTAPSAGPVTLADLPVGDEDEGIEVIDLIEAIVDNGNITLVVNAPNEGAIPNLPDEAIVEVNAQINAYGIRPIQTGPLPEALAAHLRRYFDFQQHVVQGRSERRSQGRRCTPSCSTRPPRSRLDLDQTRSAAGRDAGGERAVPAVVRLTPP